MEHFGDALLPYLPVNYKSTENTFRKPTSLPITIKSKIKYVNVRPIPANRILWDRQSVFPDSTMKGPRREIRCVTEFKMLCKSIYFYQMVNVEIFYLFHCNVILGLHLPVGVQCHQVT